MLGGKRVVMDLLRDHGRVLLRFSWMSCCCCCFSTHQSLPVRCLLVHFPFGIVQLGLLVGFLLGGCRCLGMLLVWFMLVVVARMVVGLRWVLSRKRIRLNRKPQHTSWVILCILGHVFGRGCIVLGFQMFQVLIVRGGDAISMMTGLLLFSTRLGWDNSWSVRRPTSPGLYA